MAPQGKALPAVFQPNSIDEAGKWFWNFLKNELTPYPGRAWVVARVTISATLVMLLVMTFQIPNGFLGAIFTLFLSRENPTATFVAGLRTIAAFLLATAYTLIGAAMFVDEPLTHFLGVGVSLFVSFFLISITNDYGTAVAFGFTIAGAIPLWDRNTLNVNDRVEDTLWLAGVVAMGVVVTIAVEYVFRRVHPTTDLTEGIEVRLQTVETVLRCAAAERPLDSVSERVFRFMQRRYCEAAKAHPSIAIQPALQSAIGHGDCTAGAIGGRRRQFPARSRRARKADGGDLRRTSTRPTRPAASAWQTRSRNSAKIWLKADSRKDPAACAAGTLEAAILVDHGKDRCAYSGSIFGVYHDRGVGSAPLDEEQPPHFFARDAFSNPAHVQFALRGTLASMASYIIYTAIDWPGLSTSIATCIITALSTIGSSRQKQFLRLGGAIIGGFIFGFGAQVFVLPYLDSITGFTLLFMFVTAISSWIATASPRLSYLGVQLALAFYLINLQEFTIQTSLSIARDRVFGVLLGLMSMWLIYDRLWEKNALDEMQRSLPATSRCLRS